MALKSETRQVMYGLMGPRDDYHRAAENLFPLATSTVPGGCNQSTLSPVFAVVNYCPACREAEKQWLAENPGK